MSSIHLIILLSILSLCVQCLGTIPLSRERSDRRMVFCPCGSPSLVSPPKVESTHFPIEGAMVQNPFFTMLFHSGRKSLRPALSNSLLRMPASNLRRCRTIGATSKPPGSRCVKQKNNSKLSNKLQIVRGNTSSFQDCRPDVRNKFEQDHP